LFVEQYVNCSRSLTWRGVSRLTF